MKIKNLIITLALLFPMANMVNAQTGVDSNSKFGHGEDSIRCRQNISLLSSYAKAKNYKDAYEFWKQAKDECPQASKNIYIYGARILQWKIANATTKEEKNQFIEDLLNLYDLRVQYFGDDARYGEDWIVSSKIGDYLRIMGARPDYNRVYEWVKPVVEKYGEKTNPQTVYFFVFSSMNKAIGNKEWHEQYVNDYMYGNGILSKEIETLEANDNAADMVNNLNTMKNQLDELFAQSGLADCNMLNEIYGRRLEENKENITYLQAMLDMYRYADCEKSDMYFKASKYMYAIKPTAAAAMGLAKEAMGNNKFSEANKYLTDAIELTTDKKLKGSIYNTLAIISMNSKRYSEARTYCNKAMAENPSMGQPLILIAQMYAATASSIFSDDATKQRCVYFLVVDKLEKARTIDPKVAKEANRLIANYRRYFPSGSDIFMHPELNQGESIYIGGWIGENTRIR